MTNRIVSRQTYIANYRISVDDVVYEQGTHVELTDSQALSVAEYVTLADAVTPEAASNAAKASNSKAD
jgi:hypothetical protein